MSLCWTEQARLARDVAAGVGYLHRMNVIHRDLNSHNCLVREVPNNMSSKQAILNSLRAQFLKRLI